LRGTDKRQLKDTMKDSTVDLNRLQMSSGDQELNGGMLASIEDDRRVFWR